MANQRWTADRNIQFIIEYQRNECLWDPKDPRYKNRDAREAILESTNLNHDDSPDSVEEQVEILRSEQSSLTSSPLTVCNAVCVCNAAQEKIVPILHNSQDVKRSKGKNPENWIKNVRKNKRNIGETYTTNKGKIIQSKKCGTDDYLMAMCQDGTIPKNYHYFYKNLPAESVTGMNKSQQDGDYLELLAAGIAG
ncbi:hypothetical protein ACJJTC_018192 [Scirpophaga incertulas]